MQSKSKHTAKGRDLFKLAIGNLSRRKSRTFLTILGVIVGTACIVLMLSIGWSNYSQFARMLEDKPALTRIEINDWSSDQPRITDSVLQTIALLPHVEAVSPVVEIPAQIVIGPYTASTGVRGIDADVLEFDFEEGRMFDPQAPMPQLVVGGNAVRSFVDPTNPPDWSDYAAYEAYRPAIDWLQSAAQLQPGYSSEDGDMPAGIVYRAQVTGVTKAGAGTDPEYIYMPLQTAQRIRSENSALMEDLGLPVFGSRQAYIRTDHMDNVPAVQEEIRKLGFEMYSETDYIVEMRQEQARQQGQLLAIGIISLLVSAIGIANTMYASVLERRRDIGIMKVMGMRRREILRLFLAEAALIGLVGGLVGLVVSAVVVLAINTGSEQQSFLGIWFSEGMQITIPAWVAGGAIGAAVLTGILSGIWPAGKAASMSALEAMRQGR